MPSKKNYWLMKSEPECFSIDHLKACPKQTDKWDGVRNYQARNFMRDDMKVGDLVFFYHSNAKPAGVVGICEIASKPYPDPTQFDPKSQYYDETSSHDNPRWILVDVKFKKKLKRLVSIQEVKANPKLKEMKLVQKGQRLSIQPVLEKEWDEIIKMSEFSLV